MENIKFNLFLCNEQNAFVLLREAQLRYFREALVVEACFNRLTRVSHVESIAYEDE